MDFSSNDESTSKHLKNIQSTPYIQEEPKTKVFNTNFNISNMRMYHRFNSQQPGHKTIEQICHEFNNYCPKSEIVDVLQLQKSQYATIKKFKESVYFGEIVQGIKNGKGIMYYTNGRIYEGQWKDNFKQGKGYEQFNNGAIYQGSYVKGKPEGYGRYTWDNGETYEGQWVNGMKNGSGIWRGPQGDSYIGQWKDGKADGYGVHTRANGDRYEGQFINCLKHGEGVETFANGDSYKGFYENGKPSGFGQYYWATGSFFKGNFQNGLRCGKGIWKRGPGDSDKYEGEYNDDKKDGYGVFIWANGNIYKGNFQYDQKHGYGQMYWYDGTSYKGEWENDHQVGQPPKNPYSEDQGFMIVNNQKKNKGESVLNANENEFYEEKKFTYHQPKHPSVFQTTQKKFRARQISSKRSTRANHSSKTSRKYLSESYSNPPKLKTKHSWNFNRSSTYQKKSPYMNRNDKNNIMSSSFFLYKIHGQNSAYAINNNPNAAKVRMVKTSGGMRQKHISEELKNFTRNKINVID